MGLGKNLGGWREVSGTLRMDLKSIKVFQACFQGGFIGLREIFKGDLAGLGSLRQRFLKV